jgi:uncharacterized protein (TIGR03067 family)
MDRRELEQGLERSGTRPAVKGALAPWLFWWGGCVVLVAGVILVGVLVAGCFTGKKPSQGTEAKPPAARAPAPAPDPKKDAPGPGPERRIADLDGDWEPVGMTVNGRSAGAPLAGLSYAFEDDELFTRRGRLEIERADVELDPPHITLSYTGGRAKGKIIRALYRREGHKLTIAYTPDGKDFPPDLSPGKGRVVVTLRRTK